MQNETLFTRAFEILSTLPKPSASTLEWIEDARPVYESINRESAVSVDMPEQQHA